MEVGLQRIQCQVRCPGWMEGWLGLGCDGMNEILASTDGGGRWEPSNKTHGPATGGLRGCVAAVALRTAISKPSDGWVAALRVEDPAVGPFFSGCRFDLDRSISDLDSSSSETSRALSLTYMRCTFGSYAQRLRSRVVSKYNHHIWLPSCRPTRTSPC